MEDSYESQMNRAKLLLASDVCPIRCTLDSSFLAIEPLSKMQVALSQIIDEYSRSSPKQFTETVYGPFMALFQVEFCHNKGLLADVDASFVASVGTKLEAFVTDVDVSEYRVSPSTTFETVAQQLARQGCAVVHQGCFSAATAKQMFSDLIEVEEKISCLVAVVRTRIHQIADEAAEQVMKVVQNLRGDLPRAKSSKCPHDGTYGDVVESDIKRSRVAEPGKESDNKDALMPCPIGSHNDKF
jgi:hypothetical protein